jgi:type VI secretion system protein ImpI/type VI secretion system protein
MTLVLRVLRGPAAVVDEQREVAGGHISLGRGPESDWHLPDPERVLSKRHCEIVATGRGWSVTDVSSNGTSLNGAALEPNRPHSLVDQDRLTIGSYELEVRIDDGAGADLAFDPPTRVERRLTGDPFSPLDGDPLELARPDVGLPADFDPLVTGDAVTESPFAVPDQVSSLNENFRPPRYDKELLPADWDSDDETPTPPQATPAAPAPPPPPSPDPSALAAFAAGAGLKRVPSGDPDVTLRGVGAAFRAAVSGMRRMMIARATVKDEFHISQTMIRAAGNNPLKFSADDDDALAGLLGIGRDAGMSPERAITEAFRDMRLHELAVASAMQQAVRDVLAGLAPSRVMFADPETVMDRALGLHKRAAWDNYRRLHAETMRALADDFDSVFGRAFARAYEAALTAISAQGAEHEP